MKNKTMQIINNIKNIIDEIHFNFKHLLGLTGTSILVFAVAFTIMNNNRSTVAAESLNTKINETYNKKPISVSYGDDTALINTAKEILSEKISTVSKPEKCLNKESTYDFGNYIVNFEKVSNEKVVMNIETKDTINKKDIQNVEISCGDKNEFIDGTIYTYNLKVKYVDTTAPEIVLYTNNVEIDDNEQNFDIKNYINYVKDNKDTNVNYSVNGKIDEKDGKFIPGTYEYTITAIDSSSNKTQAKINVKVNKSEETLKEENKDDDKVQSEEQSSNDNKVTNAKDDTQTDNNVTNKPSVAETQNIVGHSNGGGIVGTARSLIGSNYVFGATGPSAFDCSGFVQYVYKQNGISIPRTSSQQATVGSPVSGGMSNWKAGDIVVYGGHVAIYSGHGTLIHALNPTQGVLETPGTECGAGPVIAVRRI